MDVNAPASIDTPMEIVIKFTSSWRGGIARGPGRLGAVGV